MQTAVLSKPQRRGSPIGVREDAIEGRFRSIPTHQLVLAWWLHTAGHVSRRQLRVYFAAHEMHERRRYTAKGPASARRRPAYRLDELKALVGGRGSPTADADLTADIRHLARLGLVNIEDRAITFASSADQIAIDDLAGFWAMFDQVPNQGRSVPVPRRTLRAMAGGFSRAVTGVMLALMIRSLFWHKERGDYRIDGRTKGVWIANVFGLSRRAVTDARSHLLSLGWLSSIEARQWELNRWGSHDQINVEWSASNQQGSREGEGGEFASPTSDNRAESASPDLNQSASPTEKDLKTRRLGGTPVRPGVSGNFLLRKKQKPRKAGSVTLQNIEAEYLNDTASLLLLFDQATAAGYLPGSEAGRLDFFALAERARARARNPGGMFRWLIANNRFDFITIADEDAAVQRLREWRNGRAERSHARDEDPAPKPKARALTDDDKLVIACLNIGERRGIDPFIAARSVRADWTRDHWEKALKAYEQRVFQ